jgi:hypothetical protein
MLGIGRSASAVATGAIVVAVAETAGAEALASEVVATEVTLGPFRTAQKSPPAARSATSATTGIQTGKTDRGGIVEAFRATPRLPSVVASVRARAISPREEPVP